MSNYFKTGDFVKTPSGHGDVVSTPSATTVEVLVDEEIEIFSVYDVEMIADDDEFETAPAGWDSTDFRD